jgi:hypothetical protein
MILYLTDTHYLTSQNRAVKVLPREVPVLHIAGWRELRPRPREEDHTLHQEDQGAPMLRCSAGRRQPLLEEDSQEGQEHKPLAKQRQTTACKPRQEKGVQMLVHGKNIGSCK